MTIATQTIDLLNPFDVSALIRPLRFVGSEYAEDVEPDGSSSVENAQYDGAITENLLRNGKHESTLTTVQPLGQLHSAAEMQHLRRQLTTLFTDARDEAFEDGMESEFSSRLVSLLDQQGDAAMNQVLLFIEQGDVEPEVLAEALRWFGHMEDGPCYAHRRWILEQSLYAPSIIVRDGAILGLSFLEDPRSIPALERAQRYEVHDTLRADIEQVIHDLGELRPLEIDAGLAKI